MDRITQLLDNIQNLSEAELGELRDAIVSTFNEVDKQDLTRESVEQLTALGAAAQEVNNETERRASELAELETARASAAALVNGNPTEASADEDEEEVAAEKTETSAPVEEDEEEETPRPKKKVETPAAASVEEAPAEVPTEEVTEPVNTDAELSIADGTPAVVDSAPVEEVEETVEVEETAPAEEAKEEEAEVEAAETPAEEPAEEPEVVESEANTEAETEEVEEKTSDEDTVVETAEADAVETDSDSEEQTVTAAANNTENLVIEVPQDRQVEAKVETAPVTITAGADIPGISAGSALPDLKAVAQAIIDRKKGMGRTSGGDGEQHTVATFSTSFPEERTLKSHDFDGNSKKVRSVVSEQALVAAGGLLAPVPVSYDIFGLGDLGRPVRDSLAVFQADRGGIRFVEPPVLTDLNGSVSLWTLQDDIDAATEGAPDPVKPCIRVAAGAEVTVYTDAIPLCLTFGNMGARAYPEMVERHTQLGMIQHARFAETRLLTRIGSLSTAVTAATQLGAARDLFVQVDQAAAAYRSRHRMDDESKLRAIFPAWFKNALRADLTKQLPGDGNDDTFGLAEAKINAWFAVRGIEVTWAMDGESGQIFGEQAAGALLSFPSNVIWYLFAEGTFLFLDGGTLDLGLVRDSTLNGTNDYKIFLETFEGVAKVGVEALKVTSALAIFGSSSGTEDINTVIA